MCSLSYEAPKPQDLMEAAHFLKPHLLHGRQNVLQDGCLPAISASQSFL